MADIRLAGPADREEILRLTPMIHDEIGSLSYSAPRVTAIVDRALDRRGGFIGVAGDADDIKGCVCLVLDQLSYSDDWLVVELWNYVRPDARHGMLGQHLLNFSKDIARKMGMKLFIGVLNNVRTEAKIRVYDRLLPRAGAFYIFDPNDEEAKGGIRDVSHTLHVSRTLDRKLRRIATAKGCKIHDLLMKTISEIPMPIETAKGGAS